MRTTTFLDSPGNAQANDWSEMDDCSLQRLCHSDTALRMGINNTPGPVERANLLRLRSLLLKVKDVLRHPIIITSGYRCACLNEAVGGVPNSQHVSGQAVDFRCPDFGGPADVARELCLKNLPFDQLILEFGRWIHLSVPDSGTDPRREVLTIRSSAEGYLDGLIDTNGQKLI